MLVPIESSEVRHFTPDSLKDIENPPVFRLRAPDERHTRRFRRLAIEEGVRYHSHADFRERIEAAILEL
jgi:hypothetical protein